MAVIYWLVVGLFAGILHIIRATRFDFNKMEKIDYYIFFLSIPAGLFGLIAFFATGLISRFVLGDEYYEGD